MSDSKSLCCDYVAHSANLRILIGCVLWIPGAFRAARLSGRAGCYFSCSPALCRPDELCFCFPLRLLLVVDFAAARRQIPRKEGKQGKAGPDRSKQNCFTELEKNRKEPGPQPVLRIRKVLSHFPVSIRLEPSLTRHLGKLQLHCCLIASCFERGTLFKNSNFSVQSIKFVTKIFSLGSQLFSYWNCELKIGGIAAVVCRGWYLRSSSDFPS